MNGSTGSFGLKACCWEEEGVGPDREGPACAAVEGEGDEEIEEGEGDDELEGDNELEVEGEDEVEV